MDKDLQVAKSIEIDATPAQVWEALTNPKMIKVYLFGTQTTTDWHVGSPILFEGEYNGQTYRDKGVVLKSIPNNILQYSYWSAFSGLEDKPENYSEVTYKIDSISVSQVRFTWKQVGFASKENCEHSERGLGAMLEQIKNLVETKDDQTK